MQQEVQHPNVFAIDCMQLLVCDVYYRYNGHILGLVKYLMGIQLCPAANTRSTFVMSRQKHGDWGDHEVEKTIKA